MPVEKVWVFVRHGSVVGEGDPLFVGIRNEEGELREYPWESMDGVWRLGPFFDRTYDTTGETTLPGSPEEMEALIARLAANDLIAACDVHEQLCHDGEPCHSSRVGMVAFIAHALGLMPVHMTAVAESLSEYEHEHQHRHGER